MKNQIFNKNELIKVEDNLPKHSLDEFEIRQIVYLRGGGPDMWVLAIYGEK